MADPVEVQRYDLEPVDSFGAAYTIGDKPSPTGEVCTWDDVAPLLAELATLRERTRCRDAATEPPAEGEWVLVRDWDGNDEVLRYSADAWLDHDPRYWWPLPQTEER